MDAITQILELFPNVNIKGLKSFINLFYGRKIEDLCFYRHIYTENTPNSFLVQKLTQHIVKEINTNLSPTESFSSLKVLKSVNQIELAFLIESKTHTLVIVQSSDIFNMDYPQLQRISFKLEHTVPKGSHFYSSNFLVINHQSVPYNILKDILSSEFNFNLIIPTLKEPTLLSYTDNKQELVARIDYVLNQGELKEFMQTIQTYDKFGWRYKGSKYQKEDDKCYFDPESGISLRLADMLGLYVVNHGSRRVVLNLNQYVLKVWFKSDKQQRIEQEYFKNSEFPEYTPDDLYMSQQFILCKKYLTYEEVLEGEASFNFLLRSSSLGQEVISLYPNDADEQHRYLDDYLEEQRNELCRILHKSGYATMDLHDENIGVDPDTGDLVIIDAGYVYKLSDKIDGCFSSDRYFTYNIANHRTDMFFKEEDGKYALGFTLDKEPISLPISLPSEVGDLISDVKTALLLEILQACENTLHPTVESFLQFIDSKLQQSDDFLTNLYYFSVESTSDAQIYNIQLNQHSPEGEVNLASYAYEKFQCVQYSITNTLSIELTRSNPRCKSKGEVLRNAYYLIEEVMDAGLIKEVSFNEDIIQIENQNSFRSITSTIKSF